MRPVFVNIGERTNVTGSARFKKLIVEGDFNAALDVAMRIKPERHHFVIDQPGGAPALARHMSMTGG